MLLNFLAAADLGAVSTLGHWQYPGWIIQMPLALVVPEPVRRWGMSGNTRRRGVAKSAISDPDNKVVVCYIGSTNV